MTTDNFCFYLQIRLIQTSQTGGKPYSDTSPFSIPCLILTKREGSGHCFRQAPSGPMILAFLHAWQAFSLVLEQPPRHSWSQMANWCQCCKTFLCVSAGNTSWGGRLRTVDLLVITCLDQLLFVLKILFTFLTNQATLMRRSTILSLHPQLEFRGR